MPIFIYRLMYIIFHFFGVSKKFLYSFYHGLTHKQNKNLHYFSNIKFLSMFFIIFYMVIQTHNSVVYMYLYQSLSLTKNRNTYDLLDQGKNITLFSPTI